MANEIKRKYKPEKTKIQNADYIEKAGKLRGRAIKIYPLALKSDEKSGNKSAKNSPKGAETTCSPVLKYAFVSEEKSSLSQLLRDSDFLLDPNFSAHERDNINRFHNMLRRQRNEFDASCALPVFNELISAFKKDSYCQQFPFERTEFYQFLSSPGEFLNYVQSVKRGREQTISDIKDLIKEHIELEKLMGSHKDRLEEESEIFPGKFDAGLAKFKDLINKSAESSQKLHVEALTAKIGEVFNVRSNLQGSLKELEGQTGNFELLIKYAGQLVGMPAKSDDNQLKKVASEYKALHDKKIFEQQVAASKMTLHEAIKVDQEKDKLFALAVVKKHINNVDDAEANEDEVLNLLDNDGNTPLDLAVKCNNNPVYRLLVEAGAQHSQQHNKLLNQLLAQQAVAKHNIRQTDRTGLTPLGLAADFKNQPTHQLLPKADAVYSPVYPEAAVTIPTAANQRVDVQEVSAVQGEHSLQLPEESTIKAKNGERRQTSTGVKKLGASLGAKKKRAKKREAENLGSQRVESPTSNQDYGSDLDVSDSDSEYSVLSISESLSDSDLQPDDLLSTGDGRAQEPKPEPKPESKQTESKQPTSAPKWLDYAKGVLIFLNIISIMSVYLAPYKLLAVLTASMTPYLLVASVVLTACFVLVSLLATTATQARNGKQGYKAGLAVVALAALLLLAFIPAVAAFIASMVVIPTIILEVLPTLLVVVASIITLRADQYHQAAGWAKAEDISQEEVIISAPKADPVGNIVSSQIAASNERFTMASSPESLTKLGLEKQVHVSDVQQDPSKINANPVSQVGHHVGGNIKPAQHSQEIFAQTVAAEVTNPKEKEPGDLMVNYYRLKKELDEVVAKAQERASVERAAWAQADRIKKQQEKEAEAVRRPQASATFSTIHRKGESELKPSQVSVTSPDLSAKMAEIFEKMNSPDSWKSGHFEELVRVVKKFLEKNNMKGVDGLLGEKNIFNFLRANRKSPTVQGRDARMLIAALWGEYIYRRGLASLSALPVDSSSQNFGQSSRQLIELGADSLPSDLEKNLANMLVNEIMNLSVLSSAPRNARVRPENVGFTIDAVFLDDGLLKMLQQKDNLSEKAKKIANVLPCFIDNPNVKIPKDLADKVESCLRNVIKAASDSPQYQKLFSNGKGAESATGLSADPFKFFTPIASQPGDDHRLHG